MGLVALLVVLNHLPDIQLSFIPNGHVAEVKYIRASLFIFICFTV